MHYAHERLREINSLRIIGTTKDKGPIVSFEIKGAHPHDVATIIDRAGVAVRAGTHCVMPLLARFGVTATCRASFAMYNTREEVDCLAQALVKAQDFSHDRRHHRPTSNRCRQAPRRADTGGTAIRHSGRRNGAPDRRIVGALKTVYDPEIPADIYELGLIYKVDIDDDRMVKIDMTLTTPNCPSAAELPAQVENAVAGVPGVREAKVNIVWDPPWDPSRMSDEARTDAQYVVRLRAASCAPAGALHDVK